MIKKIIHIADIHLPNSEEDRPYGEMLKVFLAHLYEDIKQYDKDEVRIILAGDIFHQKIKATNEAKTMFHMMLNYLNQFAITYIIAGNHDLLEKNKDRTDSISPTFEIHGAYPNVHYLDKELNYQSGYVEDDNVIFALFSIYDSYRTPNIKGLKTNDNCIIGLYHGDVKGSVTDVGFMSDKGIDTNNFVDCDAVMAGHVHKFQEIKQNGVPIVFAGSLFQQNSGENTTMHGYVKWHVETMKYEHCEIPNDYKIYRFHINNYDEVNEDTEKLLNL